MRDTRGDGRRHDATWKKKIRIPKFNHGNVSKATPQSRHFVSTFSFFHSHLLSVHRHPSLTSNVSRRGLFSSTPMHGQSRYVNYLAFTDGFLTPILCLLTLACPRYRCPRHLRVRIQHPRVRFSNSTYSFNTHADVFNTHMCAFDTATLDTRAYTFNTHAYAFSTRVYAFSVQHPCICGEVQVQCARGEGMGH